MQRHRRVALLQRLAAEAPGVAPECLSELSQCIAELQGGKNDQLLTDGVANPFLAARRARFHRVPLGRAWARCTCGRKSSADNPRSGQVAIARCIKNHQAHMFAVLGTPVFTLRAARFVILSNAGQHHRKKRLVQRHPEDEAQLATS